MIEDSLGNRMKEYEMAEAGRMLMPRLPVMIRCDGKAFHTFCRGLKRPYDERLSSLMAATTKFLVEQTNALIGYTQSDEISLVLHTDEPNAQLYFDGRIQKLTSVIASMATMYFNKHLATSLPERADNVALFDCRVWNVPTLEEAANCILWRELDATKNSISMAAQAYFSHKELQGKHGADMQEMLFKKKKINWNNYPPFFKRGVYVRRVTKSIAFSAVEIDKLPAKHAARKNPNLMVERSVVEQVVFPPLMQVVNRVDVLFKGHSPKAGRILTLDEVSDGWVEGRYENV